MKALLNFWKPGRAALAFIVALGMLSCAEEVTISKGGSASGDASIRFTAGSLSVRPQTRTTTGGDAWVLADSVGIFMLETGTATLSNGVDNYRYSVAAVSDGTATFAADSPLEAACYPPSGNVDFIAYYPYRSGQTLGSYAVDVSDQRDPAAIDLLCSRDATGKNSASPTVALTFHHALAKLKLKIRAGTGLSSLSGLTAVQLTDVFTGADFDLAAGSGFTSAASGNILPLITSTVTDTLREVILIPGQYAAGKVKFTVGGSDYFWDLSAISFQAGNLYNYEITVHRDGVSATGEIVPWNENSGTGTTTAADEELFEQVAELCADLVNRYLDQAVSENRQEVDMDNLLAEILQIEGITEAIPNSANTCIRLKIGEDMYAYLLVHPRDDERREMDETGNEPEPFQNPNELLMTRSDAWSINTPAGKEALFLLPYQYELDYYRGELQKRKNALESAGYNVTVVQNQAVTENHFRGSFLQQYDVVYIHTHGDCYDSEQRIFLSTSINRSYTNVPGLAIMIDPPVSGVSERRKSFLAVTDRWIDSTLRAMPDNAFVYVDACHSNQYSKLSNMFLSKGAGAFIGWDAISFSGYSEPAATYVFNHLPQGQSLQSVRIGASDTLSKELADIRADNDYKKSPLRNFNVADYRINIKEETTPYYLVLPEVETPEVTRVPSQPYMFQFRSTLKHPCAGKSYLVGFCYGLQPDPAPVVESEAYTEEIESPNGEDVEFTREFDLTSISENEECYVRAYVIVDGVALYSDIMSFNLDGVKVEEPFVTPITFGPPYEHEFSSHLKNVRVGESYTVGFLCGPVEFFDTDTVFYTQNGGFDYSTQFTATNNVYNHFSTGLPLPLPDDYFLNDSIAFYVKAYVIVDGIRQYSAPTIFANKRMGFKAEYSGSSYSINSIRIELPAGHYIVHLGYLDVDPLCPGLVCPKLIFPVVDPSYDVNSNADIFIGELESGAMCTWRIVNKSPGIGHFYSFSDYHEGENSTSFTINYAIPARDGGDIVVGECFYEGTCWPITRTTEDVLLNFEMEPIEKPGGDARFILTRPFQTVTGKREVYHNVVFE
jgi:hypothetical protein